MPSLPTWEKPTEDDLAPSHFPDSKLERLVEWLVVQEDPRVAKLFVESCFDRAHRIAHSFPFGVPDECDEGRVGAFEAVAETNSVSASPLAYEERPIAPSRADTGSLRSAVRRAESEDPRVIPTDEGETRLTD